MSALPRDKSEHDDVQSFKTSASSRTELSQTLSADTHSPRTLSPTDLEKPDRDTSPTPSIGHPISRRITTKSSVRSQHPDFEVDWKDGDPHNPQNWSSWYKCVSVILVAWSTFAVVVYSTSYSSGLYGMMKDFGIDSEPVVTLGITAYRQLLCQLT